MPTILSRLFAAAFALVLGLAGLAGGARAAPVTVLAPADVQLYITAFDAAARGDATTMRDTLGRVTDPCLAGYVEFDRLMSPDTTAEYTDLAAWLQTYGDHVGAERILTLARKRQPRDASLALHPGYAADVSGGRDSSIGFQVRDELYSGRVPQAFAMAEAAGERWVAGMAAYRLKKFDVAMDRFARVAADENEDDWLRAAAGYWGARAAISAGWPDVALSHLKGAARFPYTFYGMIAEAQLGMEPGAGVYGKGYVAPVRTPGLPSTAAAEASKRLAASDPRARRAAALAQLGRRQIAAQEARRGLTAAFGEKPRADWIAFSMQVNDPVTPRSRNGGSRPFDTSDYPTPEYNPVGGFTMDKALVYALIRQETRFNANARSSAGAYGLMQLLPASAASASGDRRLRSNPRLLLDPSINIRAGQDYIDMLLRDWARGDMVRAVAGYNGGPGAVLKAERNAGPEDTLLVIESLPAGQTREYVEKVMANYWIYRRLFGQNTRSLDAIASGAKVIDHRFDR